MKGLTWFLVVVSVFAGFVAFAATGHAADAIKVGIVDTYTGPATAFTQDVLDGFKLGVDKINAKGGVLGKKIEYIVRDEKFKPDIGLAMAKELILKERVDILMGTINSGTALAISDLARKEKVPFFVTYSKSEKIIGEKGHNYVFNMNENTEMAGRAAAIALAKKPYIKYWIAGDDYEYGHAIADAVWNNLKRLNPKVQKVGRVVVEGGRSRFYPLYHPDARRQTGFHHRRHGRIGNGQFPESGEGNRSHPEDTLLSAYGKRARRASAPG